MSMCVASSSLQSMHPCMPHSPGSPANSACPVKQASWAASPVPSILFREPLRAVVVWCLVCCGGEMDYMRMAREQALDWIRARPGEFLRLTGSRVIHFWFGLAGCPSTGCSFFLPG